MRKEKVFQVGSEKPLRMARVIALSLVFSGSQLIQELLSEAIFTKYELEQSIGEISLVYALFQHVGTLIVAFLRMNDQIESACTPPAWNYVFLLSLLVFASTTLANWAVEFVYYPAKIVAKSAKLVPTMVVATIMGNSNKFGWIDYLCAIFLSLGAAGFALSSGREATIVTTTDNKASLSPATLLLQNELAWIGLALLCVATSADALVPNMQQKMMRDGASAEQVAWRVNMVGAIAIAFVIYVYGTLFVWIEIFMSDTNLFVVMCAAGFMLGIAVLSYTLLIEEAGSVIAVVVGTLRKALTLFLSYVVFPGEGKQFTTTHLFSITLVVLGMGLSPLYRMYFEDRRSMMRENNT